MNLAQLEAPYCYYAFAIDPQGDVEHLHYGLWENGIEDIKTAQRALAQRMTSLFPTSVQRVLDSGCGLGRTAFDLASAGYTVTGISPDTHNMVLAKSLYQSPNLHLHTVSFEAYNDPSPFDLLLFQESSQYIPLPTLLDHALELLAADGYLLICDEVRYRGDPGLAFHPRQRLIDGAASRGLQLLYNCNFTEQALPTRAFLVHRLERKRRALIDAFRSARPNVQDELDHLITGWKHGTNLFNMGVYGYEAFLFQRSDREHAR